ncbi:MAG: cupin domain-containing protein [Clostridiaceae bacterium]
MKIQNINLLFASLIQDEKSDVQMLPLTEGAMSLILAELKTNKKLPAHYHSEGTEIYQIISGEGTVEFGELQNGNVLWGDRLKIKEGDVFEVMPYIVHRLSNYGNEVLRMIFFAPSSHMGSDRTFI